MPKSAILLCTLLSMFLLAGASHASPIPFDVSSEKSYVKLSNVDTIGWTDLSAELVAGLDSQIFELNDGETRAFDFFTLTTSGTGFGSADIEATLAFDEPSSIVGSGIGDTLWGTLWGSISGGVLNWSKSLPDVFVLNGTQVSIDFEDGILLSGYGVFTVQAYITNHGEVPVPTPEPATLLLMSTGLIGIALGRKRFRPEK